MKMYSRYSRVGEKESFEKVVETDGMEIQFVPRDHLTDRLKEKAVQQNGSSLRLMKPTKRLSTLAVRQNGLALEYVPFDLMDEELILEAVKRDGLAVKFVPFHLLSKKILLAAVRQNGLALADQTISVDRAFRNAGLSLGNVHPNGFMKQSIPKHLLDREIFSEAVKQNRAAIDHVPVKERWGELAEVPGEGRGIEAGGTCLVEREN